MAKSTDTQTVLRMLRKLLEVQRENPEKAPGEMNATMYNVGRREGIGLAITAINEALGEK